MPLLCLLSCRLHFWTPVMLLSVSFRIEYTFGLPRRRCLCLLSCRVHYWTPMSRLSVSPAVSSILLDSNVAFICDLEVYSTLLHRYNSFPFLPSVACRVKRHTALPIANTNRAILTHGPTGPGPVARNFRRPKILRRSSVPGLL